MEDRPARIVRKPVPRLIHSCTTMISGRIYCSVVNHWIGSVISPIWISQLLA